jgi:hypothetical protein
MRARTRWLVLLGILAMRTGTLEGQLGEFHVGAVAGYGTGNAWQGGAGLIVAVVPGRLAYLGLRWVRHAGAPQRTAGEDASREATTRAQVLAADLGFQFPAGGVEVVPGVSLGAARLSQRIAGGVASPETHGSWEFHAAPSLAVYVPVHRILLAPEVQFALTGDPDFRPRAGVRGPVFYLRVVIPFEIDRIRY